MALKSHNSKAQSYLLSQLTYNLKQTLRPLPFNCMCRQVFLYIPNHCGQCQEGGCSKRMWPRLGGWCKRLQLKGAKFAKKFQNHPSKLSYIGELKEILKLSTLGMNDLK